MGRYFALTGTPGTGKSRVARELRKSVAVLTVGAVAARFGGSAGNGRSRVIDVKRVGEAMEREDPVGDVVVEGHLAHLLPAGAAVVLRCNPVVLGTRLRRARRGTAAERKENVVAEAVDVVLMEALEHVPLVWEIDTTHATPTAVARRALRLYRTQPPPQVGRVDWLSDPKVTAYLLA